jgi:hypothetical protein
MKRGFDSRVLLSQSFTYSLKDSQTEAYGAPVHKAAGSVKWPRDLESGDRTNEDMHDGFERSDQ